jgi:hypothetical protein
MDVRYLVNPVLSGASAPNDAMKERNKTRPAVDGMVEWRKRYLAIRQDLPATIAASEFFTVLRNGNGISYRNRVVSVAFHEMAEKGFFTEFIVAEAGSKTPCSEGGLVSARVNPARKEEFVLFLLQKVFGYKVDMELFREGDTYVGLDKKQRDEFQADEDARLKLDKKAMRFKRGTSRDWKTFIQCLSPTGTRLCFVPERSREHGAWRDAFWGIKRFIHVPQDSDENPSSSAKKQKVQP